MSISIQLIYNCKFKISNYSFIYSPENLKQMDLSQHSNSSSMNIDQKVLNDAIQNCDESYQTLKINFAHLLNSLKYEEVKQCLSALNQRLRKQDFKNVATFGHAEFYKYVFLSELLNHLIDHFKILNSSSDFDIDAILQLIILSIPISSPPPPLKKEHLKSFTNVSNLIQMILTSSAAVDFKYAFVMYRSKCMQLIHMEANTEPNLIGLIQYFKYLSGCHVLMAKMKQQKMSMIFKQYLEMLEEARKLYEGLYQYEEILGRQVQVLADHEKVKDNYQSTNYDMQLVNLVHMEYLTFCYSIAEQCSKILKVENQVRSQIYQIIDFSISHLVMIVPKQQKKPMMHEKQSLLKNKLSSLIIFQNLQNSNGRSFSLKSLSGYPSLLQLEIFTSNLQMLISKQNYLYLLYSLFISFSQSNTIDTIAGGKWDQMYNHYLSIVSELCTYLIQIQSVIQSKKSVTYPRVISQLLYLNEQFFINLPNLYYKLSIFNGFISSSHQLANNCQSQIREILCLPRGRYNQAVCPRSSLKLWSKFLQWSSENEIQYRIYCMTQYRKLLSSSFLRKQISQGRFEIREGHGYHRHTWILIDAYEKISGEINTIMKKLENINYNYVGHVVSFIANYLVCIKLYLKNEKMNKWDGHQKQKLRDHRQGLKRLVQKMRMEMQKKLQMEAKKHKEYEITADSNHNRSTIELQLVIFRCKQLHFNQ